MASRFRHAALVGKYQAHGIRPVLEEIAHFLVRQGLEVSLEKQTAQSTGITGYGAFTPDELGRHCDIAVVVGGDGTMLGVARELARHGTPEIVNTDQGSQFTAQEFVDAVLQVGAKLSMDGRGAWRDNVFV